MVLNNGNLKRYECYYTNSYLITDTKSFFK